MIFTPKISCQAVFIWHTIVIFCLYRVNLMPAQLPPFILDILPPIYVAFNRVFARFQVSAGDLLSLRLLCNSNVTIGGREVMLLTDLIDRIRKGMGYMADGAASEVLKKLNDKGLIEKRALTSTQLQQHFPPGSRRGAVLLNEAGKHLFENICKELEKVAGEFLDQLSPEVQERFNRLFAAAREYPDLATVLETALLTGPESGEPSAAEGVPADATLDADERFIAACERYLGGDLSGHQELFSAWYQKHLPTLPPDQTAAFLSELERSAAATPAGRQRRATAEVNSDAEKLRQFLDNLIRKYRDA